MFVITGASGKLGQAIIQRLIKKVPAEKIGISVRDPTKAEHFASQGIRVRQGDFSDSKSLHHSMEGAETVLIISANSLEHGHKFSTNAIDAAKACGAKRILYTSHQGSSSTSHFPPMLSHAATEDTLKNSGVNFTSLRNGFYADATARFLASAKKDGKIVAPADGPMSWTTHADLADAAVAALLDPTVTGITAPLTANQSLDLDAIAKIASEVLGKEVQRITVPDDEFKKSLLTYLPPPVADMFMGMFIASRNREFDVVDPFLGKLIGRPTTPFRQYVVDEFEKTASK